MGDRPTISRKLVIPAVVAALMTSACASDQGDTPVINTVDANSAALTKAGKPMDVGSSGLGNYLAGRQALKLRDFSAAAKYLSRALADNPNDELLLRRTFLARISEGKVHEAIDMAHRIVDEDSTSPIAQLALVVDDVKIGKLARAEAQLSSFPDRGFSGFMKPLLRAWVIVGQGKGKEALAALEPLRHQEGLRVLYELHAALIADVAGMPDVAIAHFKAAAGNSQRETLRVVQGLGRHYERAGEPAKAKALYESYMKENPESVVLGPALARIAAGRKPPLLVGSAADGVAEALFNIASTITRDNSSQLALIYGRLATYLRPHFDLAQMLVAGILETMDRYDDAIASYDRVPQTSPLFWSAQLRIASNLDALDRDAEATRLLQRLARMFPNRAETFISLGDIYRANKKFRESVDAYDQAVKLLGRIDRRHWTLLYSRGISLERSNQWARAEKDFRDALKLNPDQPYVLNYLGYSWVDQGKNLAQAQKMIERAVELRPDDGYIVDSLGWVMYRLKRYPAAVEQLERAVELRPQDPTINDHLGDAYWRVGRRNEARYQWERVLSLDPDPEMIPGIKRKLEHGLGPVPASGKDS